MRIIKDIPQYHMDDRYYDENTPRGKLITHLSSQIGNESTFLSALSQITFWDHTKISLWSFEPILNYIDDLLAQYKKSISQKTKELIIIFSFYKILFNNCVNKDVFASFDHLQEIFFNSYSIEIKVQILEIYACFMEVNKTIQNYFMDFEEFGGVLVSVREILIEILLNNNYKEISQLNIKALEKNLNFIQKDWHKAVVKKNSCACPGGVKVNEVSPVAIFNKIVNEKKHFRNKENFLENQIEYEYFTTNIIDKKLNLSREEKRFIMLTNNYLVFVSELIINPTMERMKQITQFTLILINFYITYSQKHKTQPIIITEYYIEKYLKDVLSILTSKNDLELKSIFLSSCISFMNNLDGYESILFQNGLFHSILSDLTHQNDNNLEVLSYEESINQEFFKSILEFLYKSSSFKEIPVHFLNKVLEVPSKDHVYPFRIDNVIFSLKKKKILDENTLNDLILPRLLYELDNIYVDSSLITYSTDKTYHSPTIFERTNLISKLFKILFKIFEQNINLNSLRSYETRLITSVTNVLSSEKYISCCDYDFLCYSCVEFIIKICTFYPSKIPNLIETKVLDVVLSFFNKKIPKMNGALGLLFQMYYGICLHEEGKKYLLKDDSSIKILDKVFEQLISDESYLHLNLFNVSYILEGELYSPYIAFLRIEGVNSIIESFFDRVKKLMQKVKEKILSIKLPHDNSIAPSRQSYEIIKYIHLLYQFFGGISIEDKNYLLNTVKVSIEPLMMEYYDMIFNPTILYCVSNTIITSPIVKIISQTNPNEFIKKLNVKFNSLLKEISDSSLSQIQKDKATSTLLKICDITIKKIYSNLSDKSLLDEMSITITSLIIKLIKKQSTISVYMAPLNDCILIINQKSFYKYLSQKMKSEIRDLILKNTFENIGLNLPTVVNPKLNLIDDSNYLNVEYDVDFSKILRVEIIESQTAFTTELVDPETRIMLNNIPALEFFFTLGKTMKIKGLREIKENEISSIKTYMNLAYLLCEISNAIRIKDRAMCKDLTYEQQLEYLICYICTLNNLNIISLEKNFSSFVIFYFIKYGGIRIIFEMSKDIICISEAIAKKSKRAPLVILLLIKNLWNIISSLIVSFMKYEFEKQDGYYLILLREDVSKFNLKNELSVYVKYLIMNDLIEVFFSKKDQFDYSLKDIAKYAYNFHSVLFSIINDSISQYKTLIEWNLNKNVEDIRIIDFEQMGFKKYAIVQALQEGMKKTDEIVNYLITKNEVKEDEKEQPKEENNTHAEQQGQNENNAIVVEPAQPNSNQEQGDVVMANQQQGVSNNNNEQNAEKEEEKQPKINPHLLDICNMSSYPSPSFFSLLSQINPDFDAMVIEDNSNSNIPKSSHRNDLLGYSKENYISNLSLIYNILASDDTTTESIIQLRKMNLEYRIKEIKNETELIESLRQILFIERENLIDMTSQTNTHSLEKILQNKMMINYIIFKDRSKYSNFFEKLDIEKLNAFLNEFKVIEMNLQSISYYLQLKTEKSNDELIRRIIYESHMLIYIVMSFMSHYSKEKIPPHSYAPVKEEDPVEAELLRYKKQYMETFFTSLSSQEKMNESILVLILMTINQNFNNEKEHLILSEYVEKGILGKIFKLKSTNEKNYTTFYQNQFKAMVTVDEAIRMFIFKLFIDEKSHENLLEGLFKYIIANLNEKSNEIEMESFLELVSGYMAIETSIFKKVLEKMFNVVQREEKKEEEDDSEEEEEESEEDKDKKEKKKSSKKVIKYYLRLKEEYTKQVSVISTELRPKNEKDTNGINEEDFHSPKTSQLQSQQTKSVPATSSARKKTEDQMTKITQIFSNNNLIIINTLLKHIWLTCTENEKDIDRIYTQNVNVPQVRKYIIDLDTVLISFASLLHAFPSLISIVLKYHKQKQKISFLNFLIRNVFFTLSYYKNTIVCPEHINSDNDMLDVLAKEKDESTKRIGSNPNSHQSVMEALRNSNIVTYIMQSLCYKRRNMNEDELFLIQKTRKKILSEINSLISEISSKKLFDFSAVNPNSPLPRGLVQFKSCLLSLYSIVEFHDDSHVFSQYNPFEISKLVFSKEFDIIKNICAMMKSMSLTNQMTSNFHRMAAMYLSEIFKFLRINAKMKKGTVILSEKSLNEDDDNNEENPNQINLEIHLDPNNDGDEDEEMEDDEDDDEDGIDNSSAEDSNEMYYPLTPSDNDGEVDYDGISIDENDGEDSSDFHEDVINIDDFDDDNHNANNDRNEGEIINLFGNRDIEVEEDDYNEENEEEEEFNDNNDVAVHFDENGNDYDSNMSSQSEFGEEIVGNNFNNSMSNNEIEIPNIRLDSVFIGPSGFVINRNGIQRASIVIGANDNDSASDEVLFFNPFIDKAMSSSNVSNSKTEMNIFFEEALTFPFVVCLYDKDELFDFYRPNVFISVMNKMGKNFVEKTTNIFIYRYINPFDIKGKRNLVFVLAGAKEKTSTTYSKEIAKITESNEYYQAETTFQEDKKEMIKWITEEMTQKEKVIVEKEEDVEMKKEDKKEEKKEEEDANKKLENDILTQIPEELREQVKNSLENNNNEQQPQQSDNNNDNKEEDNKMIVDPPQNEPNVANPEPQPSQDANNNNIPQEENIPLDNHFIDSLPQDLRQDILLNLDPSMVEHLSPELREEYHQLTEIGRLFIPGLQDYYHPVNRGLNRNSNTDLKIVKRSETLKLEKFKYKIEDILSQQKHSKEHSMYILNLFDDDFVENILIFNIKFICESQPKYTISNNHYWILINHLIQNAHLRHKILDLLFIIWICDSMRIRQLYNDSTIKPEMLNKNTLLRNLKELFIESKLPEDFFYDDYDQFIQNFCNSFQKEMKKLFLQTVYNDKGEYVSIENNKKYAITRNSYNIRDLLKITFDSGENVLSNLLSLMLKNSKSDIKKIFALKIFTNVIQNCFASNKDTNANNTIKNYDNTLHISEQTAEKIIDLFYNFETVLELSKGLRSNNPTGLLCEMILDHKFYELLLTVLQKHIELLNKNVGIEMENFFNHKKIDINVFSKPLPEIVLFKIVKFVNQINETIAKKYNDKKEKKEKEDTTQKSIAAIKKELINKLNVFIKNINNVLFKCWEKLDALLFEIGKLLKDDQKIIIPKLNRMIPYLEAFITLSHLQFLQESSEITKSNPFIMEKAYRKTPHKTPMKNMMLSPNGPYVGTFTEFFYKFCDKNKKIINLILRRYPKMFPNELLIKISNFLDLENKKKYFKFELKKLQSSKEHLNISVRRNDLFQDSFSQLCFKSPEDIRGKLTIHFEGEEAIDAGGVKREWLTLLSKEMFNPNYMLFTLAKNGTTYTPNSDSGKFNTDHLKHFEFIGRIIAKAIYDGIMIDCYFTRSFYKIISNTPLTYHDMEDYDPEYYNSLKWLLENDITGMDVYLTYSFVHDNLGQIEIIDLIENGRNIEVNEENKFDYVQKLCYAKLFDTIKPQVESFLKGFYEIIPLKLISIFDYRELELVISGLPTIDIQDLKNNTVYENYNETTPVIKYFWEILEGFDNDERAEFLQFVTGSSKVPLEGFASLQGIGGINKFKIAKVFETNFDRLPSAHTCTNQLDLPEYPSKEILSERLTFAIKEGKVGFGFI